MCLNGCDSDPCACESLNYLDHPIDGPPMVVEVDEEAALPEEIAVLREALKEEPEEEAVSPQPDPPDVLSALVGAFQQALAPEVTPELDLAERYRHSPRFRVLCELAMQRFHSIENNTPLPPDFYDQARAALQLPR